MKLQEVIVHPSPQNQLLYIPGLLASDEFHSQLKSVLEKYPTNVLLLNKDDKEIIESTQNIPQAYRELLTQIIPQLLENSLPLHIMGSSFGAWIGLQIMEEYGNRIDSLLGVSPVIDPYYASTVVTQDGIMSPDGITEIEMSMEKQNTLPENTIIYTGDTRTTLILGECDVLQREEQLHLIQGVNVNKHYISNMEHAQWAQFGMSIVENHFNGVLLESNL